MSSVSEPRRPAGLRKLKPRVLPPSADVLAELTTYEFRLLDFRLREYAECIYTPDYQDPSARRELLRAAAASAATANSCDDSGTDLLQPTGRAPTVDEERLLFRQFNFNRYCVMCVLHAYAGREMDRKGVQALLQWEAAAGRVRSEIVRRNMPLVLAMVKRTRIVGVDHSDLLSEGNLALLRSVEKFDSTRGFKFSTYACRAILKSFSRVATRATKYRVYFPVEFDPVIETSDFADLRRAGIEKDCVDELRGILGGNMASLSDIERQVIRARFALDERQEEKPRAQTLEQVGELIGVTKERVRQIQNKALAKLRVALEDVLPSR